MKKYFLIMTGLVFTTISCGNDFLDEPQPTESGLQMLLFMVLREGSYLHGSL